MPTAINKLKSSRSPRTIIQADYSSGLEATIFVVSVIMRVFELGNPRIKFPFPFWAFSGPADGGHGTEWIDKAGYKRESARLFRFIQKPGGLSYFLGIKRRIIKEEKVLEEEARIWRNSLSGLSDRDLVNTYYQFIDHYSYYYGLGAITFLYEAILSEHLTTSLLSRSPQFLNHLPALLNTDYISFIIKNERALDEIAAVRSSRHRRQLIDKYCSDFFYIRSNYQRAPELNGDFINTEIRNLRHRPAVKSIPATQKSSRLRLTAVDRKIINLLRISQAINDKRKQINLIGSYMMFRFLEEAERRRKILPSLAQRAFWFEYRGLVLRPKNLIPQLKKRVAYSVIFDHGRSRYFNYVALKERPTGADAGTAISGTPASPGVYRGRVRRVLLRSDFKKFQAGEVLVTDSTRPEFLPVMKKAGAIVTDEGGLTCHAAVVARELHKPCIVGTKEASRRLKDGDEVEVDAGKGSVAILDKKNR